MLEAWGTDLGHIQWGQEREFFADASDLIPSSEKRWSLPP